MKAILSYFVLTLACCLTAQPSLVKKVKQRDRNVNGIPERTVTDYYEDNVLVRREVVEDPNEDGVPDAGYTDIYRDNKLIYDENWGPGTIKQRHFFRDGKQVMIEIDKDGDGIFEWIVMHSDQGQPYAIFKLSDKGRIQLLGKGALEDFKKGSEAARKLHEDGSGKDDSKPRNSKPRH